MGHGATLSTEPVSRRLAASAGKPDCTSAFPRCAGQLVAKAKRRAAAEERGVGYGSGQRAGRGGPWYVHGHAHTAN